MARGEIRPKDILPDKYTGYVTLDDASGSGRFFIDKLMSSLAPICVPGTTYPANSYVMHQGLFYKVNSQMTGFESNKVTQKSIKDILEELSTSLSSLSEAIANIDAVKSASIAHEYDPDSTYPTIGTAVMYDGLRYVSNTIISTAEAWNQEHWTQKNVEDEIGNVEALLAAL